MEEHFRRHQIRLRGGRGKRKRRKIKTRGPPRGRGHKFETDGVGHLRGQQEEFLEDDQEVALAKDFLTAAHYTGDPTRLVPVRRRRQCRSAAASSASRSKPGLRERDACDNAQVYARF